MKNIRLCIWILLIFLNAGCENSGAPSSQTTSADKNGYIKRSFTYDSSETVAGKFNIRLDNNKRFSILSINGNDFEKPFYQAKIMDAFDLNGKTWVFLRVTHPVPEGVLKCDKLVIKLVNKDLSVIDSKIDTCSPFKYDIKIDADQIVFSYKTAEKNMVGEEVLTYKSGGFEVVKNIIPIYNGDIKDLQVAFDGRRFVTEGELIANGGDTTLKFVQPIFVKSEYKGEDGFVINSLALSSEKINAVDEIRVGDRGYYSIFIKCDWDDRNSCRGYDIVLNDPVYNLQSDYSDFSVIKVRAGKVILYQKDICDYKNIWLNDKLLIETEPYRCYRLYGPYVLGDDDIVAVTSADSGNGGDDSVSVDLIIINKSGEFKFAKQFPLDPEVPFWCNYDLNPIVSGSKLLFKCVAQDGRRTKTFTWTYENGEVRESR
jgi:hypothetical protein